MKRLLFAPLLLGNLGVLYAETDVKTLTNQASPKQLEESYPAPKLLLDENVKNSALQRMAERVRRLKSYIQHTKTNSPKGATSNVQQMPAKPQVAFKAPQKQAVPNVQQMPAKPQVAPTPQKATTSNVQQTPAKPRVTFKAPQKAATPNVQQTPAKPQVAFKAPQKAVTPNVQQTPARPQIAFKAPQKAATSNVQQIPSKPQVAFKAPQKQATPNVQQTPARPQIAFKAPQKAVTPNVQQTPARPQIAFKAPQKAATSNVQQIPSKPQVAFKVPQKQATPNVQQTPSKPQVAPIMPQKKDQLSPLVNQIILQKAQLKQVPESAKSLYTKMILAERAPFNASLDLEPFIKKLAIDDGCHLTNETPRSIALVVLYQTKNAPNSWSENIRLLPRQKLFLKAPENSYIRSVKLAKATPSTYINPKFTNERQLELRIERIQDRFFLHQYHAFDFTIKPFSEAEVNDPGISQDERGFRNDYNGSVGYLGHVGYLEGTSLEALQQQRKTLYAKNNLARLCAFEPGLLDSTVYRIPLVTHKIWVTSDNKPTNPSPQYIKWLENSIANNNLPSDGWTHYFWIENKAKLPELAALLSNHPNIVLRELDELDTSTFSTGDLYKSAIRERKFGKASDIIRLELLRQFGGFYLDTDYELFQSLVPFAKAYDMVVGLEPMSAYLCNAFIGSCPGHPVLDKSLDMIKRNLGTQPPAYIANAENNGFKTIVETGPAMFTLAFALAGGSKEHRDIVLPPQLIYPALSGIYPAKAVVVPNGWIPAESIGAHYWNTAWMDPRFGSQG